MNFITSKQIGVNFSDFSYNTFTSHDYINPVINLSHVVHFSPCINQYQHNCSNMHMENRVKYAIRFHLINNTCVDWNHDERLEMEKELERISNICSSIYKS